MPNNLTNQQLLKELAQRLPDFTQDELSNLFKLIMVNIPSHYREELLGAIKTTDTQLVHDSIKEVVQKTEKEKKDETIEKLRKFLTKKK